VNVDPTTQINFKALSASKFASIRRVANDAFEVLDRVAPEIGAEIRSLVTEIVFASSVPTLSFGGATSFFCWGALFLSADRYRTLVTMIDGLTHESALDTRTRVDKMRNKIRDRLAARARDLVDF
jgi:hypothetical protein